MTKQEFIEQLRNKLSGLPEDDIEDKLVFYSEMIDDRIEEGMSEEDAVGAIGDIDAIVSEIISEIPLPKLVKKKAKDKRKLRVWEIVLLILGIPVWLPLLSAAIVVILAAYIVIWSVDISLWAVGAALAGCSVGSIAMLVLECIFGSVWTGLAIFGAGLVCAGLSIFWFFGCVAATKGIVILTKKIVLSIKKLFVGGESK